MGQPAMSVGEWVGEKRTTGPRSRSAHTRRGYRVRQRRFAKRGIPYKANASEINIDKQTRFRGSCVAVARRRDTGSTGYFDVPTVTDEELEEDIAAAVVPSDDLKTGFPIPVDAE